MKALKTTLLATLFFFTKASVVLAAPPPPSIGGGGGARGSASSSDIEAAVGGFFGYTSVGNLVSNIIGLGITFAGVAMLMYLLLGGLNWITGGDDKNKIDSAQKHITNAFIGLAITASVWAIWRLAKGFFGLETVLPE